MNNHHTPDAGQNADLLARAYIDALAAAENVKTKSMLIAAQPPDPITELLGGQDHVDADDPHLRVDLVMAAALTAKAVAAEPGLAMRLRREGPILTIETHSAEMTVLVSTIFTDCAAAGSKGMHVITRDGSERGHVPERGNPDVIASINRRKLTCGIAADVRRHLPMSLQRSAEYRLSIPPIDDWAIALVIEACSGAAPASIPQEIARTADLGDLSLAIRPGLTPEECLQRLAKILEEKSRHSGDGPELDELHGYGEAMVWAKNLVADLQEYKQGRIGWDVVDNVSLLLAGPPGVGKTSFAAAVAKTARVPLVATSVAQWNAAQYLSGTLQAIRDAFAQARRNAPCVMLIDELDGISDRARIAGEHAEYWSQIVNFLLESISGLADNEGVVIIAATNFPEKIDAAVRRAGRLDRLITLEKPGPAELANIFRYHLTEDVLVNVDLMSAAMAARGKTGADVEAFVKRAKAVARRAGRELQVSDLLDQIREGRAQLTAEESHWISVHEAGHAIVGRALGTGQLVGVSIDETGGLAEFTDVAGATVSAQRVVDLICLLLAGRAAETIVFGDVSMASGLEEGSDLGRATALAEMLETKGAGKMPKIYLPANLPRNLHVPGMMAAIQERIEHGEKRALDILTANRGLLDTISDRLREAGYLSADEIDRLVADCEMLEAAQ